MFEGFMFVVGWYISYQWALDTVPNLVLGNSIHLAIHLESPDVEGFMIDSDPKLPHEQD